VSAGPQARLPNNLQIKGMTMEARKERELAFHNHRFMIGTRISKKFFGSEGVEKYYTVTEGCRSFYRGRLQQGCKGKKVLEYGCGTGSDGFVLARQGARVTGIDISDVAVQQAAERAQLEELDWLDFRVMDAEDLTFADRTFDLICGTAILHHLDLGRALPQLARTLAPEGKAIFMEPLGHNPIINLYRKLTPDLRTVDEHPLLMKDIALAKTYFGKVEAHCFNLTNLLAVPFRNWRGFGAVCKVLGALDTAMFRVLPPVRRYAWATVLVFSQPKIKASVSAR
jgi:SAM-dependent methyltransferase